MPDQNNTDTTPASEAGLILQQLNATEKELRQEIEGITFGKLVGKWVSEHVAAVGISSFISAASFIGSIVFGVFWFTENVVMAAEYNKGIAQVQKDVASASRKSEIRNLGLQRILLEQRLDYLTDKPRITPQDQVKIDKLKSDIEHIDRQLEDLQRLENRHGAP